ncbi:MAG: Rne/Rng family ribonuclease [Chitinophagales bacterium]
MNRDLIVNSTTEGVHIALLEDKVLVELHQEQSNNRFAVGDIFIGKVKKVVQGLNAAFVDIGHGKDAFLHYTDLGPQIRSLKKFIDEGLSGNRKQHLLDNFGLETDIVKTGKVTDVLEKRDVVLVQVLKEPISSKGPRLSCEVTLAGRFMVLVPFSDAVAVSRKIKQSEERERLKVLIENVKPKHFGIIVRTAAEGKKLADLHEDLNDLLSKWKKILTELSTTKAPQKVLSELSKPSSILRDLLNASFTNIIVNDANLAEDYKSYVSSIAPEVAKIVSLYKGKAPIFDFYKITKQIKAAFGKTVNMASGAYLIIEHTEALHVVDVNSGHKVSTVQNQETQALTVNLEAVNEISRQLRLRDLGGIIIIDFIDIKDPDNKKMVYRRMKEAMELDRARHTILPLSKFGLMQITRQRTRPEIKISTSEVCPTCNGTGKVKATVLLIDEIANNLSYLLNEMDYEDLQLSVHPFVESYLTKGWRSKQMQWFWQHKKWVKILANDNYFLTEYHFFDAQHEEIKL